MEEYREFLPWLVGLAGTIIAFKKDWIKSQFTHKNETILMNSNLEDVEAKSLENVEKTMSIYREMVIDLKNIISDLKLEIEELKAEVIELKNFNKDQKEFIVKQSNSLNYYEKKYGKIVK